MKYVIAHVALVILILVALVIGSSPAATSHADEPLCFSEPAIVHCISGGFRTFWEQAGGLRQFGYPLTAEYTDVTPDGIYTVQYFERARFEYHPANPPAYRVQLGRLGSELNGPPLSITEEPRAGCRFFAETGFNVCEPFISAWEKPGTTPGQGSIELYGLPLTPLIAARDSEGNPVSVQWFERARFELHGANLVLFGLVGREKLALETEPEPTVPPTVLPPVEPTVPPVPPTPLPDPIKPIQAPFPDVPCNVNVPDPVEGLQAWVTMPVVSPPYDQVVCARLIADGEPAFAAFMQAFRYTPDGVIPSIMHTTGYDGTTGFIFYIGNLPSNTVVPVEVVATYAGREYRAWTSFIRE